MTNFKAVAALMTVKQRAGQNQVMSLLTLCVTHFNAALGNQLPELIREFIVPQSTIVKIFC